MLPQFLRALADAEGKKPISVQSILHTEGSLRHTQPYDILNIIFPTLKTRTPRNRSYPTPTSKGGREVGPSSKVPEPRYRHRQSKHTVSQESMKRSITPNFNLKQSLLLNQLILQNLEKSVLYAESPLHNSRSVIPR